jgi:hypothetical protein
MIFRRPSGDIFRLALGIFSAERSATAWFRQNGLIKFIHFGLHGRPLTPHRFQGLFVIEHVSLDLLLGKVPDLPFGLDSNRNLSDPD